MRVPHLTSGALRRLTLVNVVLLAAIIVSGAVVRLTNSGLGCADWPNCSATKLVDVSTHHALIEQLNRIFSGAIGLPIALALLGAYRVRPRRDDLVRLAWILFGLFWAEAVLGGISVKVRLAWVSVTGHFLLAIALIGIALVMHHRAANPPGARRAVVPERKMRLAYAVYALTIWVLVLGTLVTAAGPHGGDSQARRLGWPLGDVARVHGASVDLLVALTLVLVVILVRSRAPRARAEPRVDHRRPDGGPRGARLRAVLQPHPGGARRLPCVRCGVRLHVGAAAAARAARCRRARRRRRGRWSGC